ncbi:MAG: hydroxyphenylacetyl-CoA thioesterase PaaI [Pseudomonadota bacterium]
MDANDRARQAADAMWSSDVASTWLGMSLEHVAEGTATLRLDVAPYHCNGHGMCHGGITFALADSAFAFACNSRNQRTVAQQNTITYLAPAMQGDTLTAHARETALNGRSGIYDVTVTRQDGTRIAEFRGLSRAIKGQIFDEAREDNL